MNRLIFIFVFHAWLSVAESQTVVIQPLMKDFGKQEQWDNPLAFFEVVNQSNKPLVFLPSFPARDLSLLLPEGNLVPGQKAIIKAQYYTDKKGPFERSVEVYHSLSDKPITLTLKGNIMGFAPDALMACPDFRVRQQSAQGYEQSFIVVDELSRKGVDQASIQVIGNNRVIKGKTNALGEFTASIDPGLHDIIVMAPGYQKLLRIFYIGKTTGQVVLELKTDELSALQQKLANQHEVQLISPEMNPPSLLPSVPVTTLDEKKYKQNHVAFLIDVSGSMREAGKMPALQEAMKSLVGVLRPIDHLAVITYSSRSQVLMPLSAIEQKDSVVSLIDGLKPFGYTRGIKGLEAAYALLETQKSAIGNNQVILATDGLFTGPGFDYNAMMQLIQDYAKKGIRLTVVGFGNDKAAHKLMKKMSDTGNGSFILMTDNQSIPSVLIDEIKKQSAIP